MRKTDNKRSALLVGVLTGCIIFFYSSLSYAGVSLSVSGGDDPGGGWAIGSLKAGATSQTDDDYWVVNNDSGETEVISIKVQDDTATEKWESGGNNTFGLETRDTTPVVFNTNKTDTIWLSAAATGNHNLGLKFTAPASGDETQEHTLTVTLTATEWVWSCGAGDLVVNHTIAYGAAPVDKTVAYETISSTLGGTGAKCWIIQNLGATHKAGSYNDSSEASRGWFWQFNRKKGFASSGSRSGWKTSISESSGWTSANDPCTELGTGWRMPTKAEWTSADSTGGWNNYIDAYNSVFKLHAAGHLDNDSVGTFNYSGTYGYHWTSFHAALTAGGYFYFRSNDCYVNNTDKCYGNSLRCLK